jgi:cytochrome P450
MSLEMSGQQEPLTDQIEAWLSGRSDLLADPYPFYARLRREAPIVSHGDIVLVSRYDDVEGILMDPRMSSRKNDTLLVDGQIDSLPEADRAVAREWKDFLSTRLSWTDPPDHTRRRRLQSHGFLPRQITGVEEYIVATTEQLMDAAEQRGGVDIANDVARQLPMRVLAHMLGVPDEDMGLIFKWSDDISVVDNYGFAKVPEKLPSLIAFRDYVEATIARRRAERRDDLLGALIEAEESGDTLTTSELTAAFYNLLLAGTETPAALITVGTYELLKHRDQWDLLCEDPAGSSAGAVEELLRWVAPAQRTRRVTREDVDWRGHRIPRDVAIYLLIGSANRDEDRFENAATLDILREDVRHLSFAIGPHFCLGNALARAEARVAFETMARRWPQMRLTAGNIEWRPNYTLRRPARLPVDVARRSPATA